MDLPGPIHDFILVFLGSDLILGGLGVVLLINPIYSAFSLGLVLVCVSLGVFVWAFSLTVARSLKKNPFVVNHLFKKITTLC